MVLPSFIGIRNAENKHLSCLPGRESSKYDLKFSEPDFLSPNAKFEVEPSSHDADLVHIRSCVNNKYWTLSGGVPQPIAEKKDEDKSKDSCTLFSFIPVDAAAGSFKIIHAQSGLCLGQVHCFHESYAGPRFDAFMVVDLGAFLRLPRYVAFKASNGKYLSPGRESLDIAKSQVVMTTETDIGAKGVAWEIVPTDHGNIRIKPMWSNTRFWALDDSSPYIGVPRKENSTNAYWRTVFRPIKVDGKTIALRCLGNNRFCHVEKNMIATYATYVVNETRLTLEEAVLNREIIGSRYDVGNARIYNQSIINVTESTARNPYGTPRKMSVTLRYKDAKSRTWKSSHSFTESVKASMEFGIPSVGAGGVEISTEVQKVEEWGKTEESSLEMEIKQEVEVPPHTMVTVSVIATRATVDVPLSYTQRDTLYDGSVTTTEVTGAYFTGSNYFNLTFDNIQEPLPNPDAKPLPGMIAFVPMDNP